MRDIAHEKLEYALKLYLEDKISLGRATEIADISICQMLNELKERNITLDYKISDAEREIEKILERYGK